LRNPVEFCAKVPAIRLPSDYSGYSINNIMLNEEMYVQNPEQYQNAGVGSSREFHVALDSDGHAIDLNSPPVNN